MAARMKSGDRRAAIIRSAIHLFAEKGFRGATTRALASAAGITEPVLYQHFGTKRALYDAVVEAKASRIPGRAAELRALSAAGDDPRGNFMRIARDVLIKNHPCQRVLSFRQTFSGQDKEYTILKIK